MMNRLKRLFPYLQKYKQNIVLHILCNILMVVFSIISIPALLPLLEVLLGVQQRQVVEKPTSLSSKEDVFNYMYYYLGQVIENEGAEQAMIYICILLAGVYFFRNLFRYLALVFITPVRNGMVRDLRQELFDKTLHLPLSYFSEERKGDLIARYTADVQEIESSILSVLEILVRSPLMIIGSLLFMLWISPSLTLFALGLMLFTVIVIGGIGKTLRRKSTVVQRKIGDLVATIEESLSGLKIIKGFNALHYQRTRFSNENNTYRYLLNRLLWRKDLASPLSEFLGIATMSVLLWYGFGEVQQGILTASTFIVFLYAFFSVIDPAKQFSKASYNIQKGIAALDRVEEVLDAEVTIREATDAQPLHDFQEAIRFENVHFAYPNADKSALAEIDLTIKKGETVALVGASGGGKSTLVDLLSRFHEVTSGAILLDGQNIKNYRLGDLRSLIGIVTQDAFLFNDTIYNNIVFGQKNVTKEQVVTAAQVANAHDFILQMEKGYDTNVGDRGVKLSGGQRQRITIARAILRDPPILVLDEATSALDSESEKLVQAALYNVMQNRTALVIAHRLSTIKDADTIIVLQDGKIAEQGTHNDLLEQNGAYSKLVSLQAV